MAMYLMYLRVGRKESLSESTLALEKYEAVLQDYSVRVLGARIPDENIFRDLASGASIENREGIKNVLARVEAGGVEGVLTYDFDHISRGDFHDTDRVIRTFRNAGTRIITPFYTLDPRSEMEMVALRSELTAREHQRELMRSVLASLRKKK